MALSDFFGPKDKSKFCNVEVHWRNCAMKVAHVDEWGRGWCKKHRPNFPVDNPTKVG